MEAVNFEHCPKFKNGDKHTKDIDNLYIVNRGIAKQLKVMAKDHKSTSRYLKRHMEEEDVHHRAVNTSLSAMGEAITSLLDDKKVRDEKKDKREGIRDKVVAAISIAMIIGAYNLVVDFMAMRQVITGG